MTRSLRDREGAIQNVVVGIRVLLLPGVYQSYTLFPEIVVHLAISAKAERSNQWPFHCDFIIWLYLFY